MADDKKIEVGFAVKLKELNDGMAKATSTIKEQTHQMEASFNGLGKAIDNIKAPFLALGAALAAGAFLKNAAEDAVEWNVQQIKLARTLGITTEEASALSVEIQSVHGTTEGYTGLIAMMNMRVAAGGKAFAKYGINVKDASGHLKASNVIFQEAMTKLNSAATAQDRASIAAELFGRRAATLGPYLKMNNELLEESKARAEKYGLTVGGESVEATNRFREAHVDADLAVKGFKVRLGNEMIPVLADFNKQMAEDGPAATEALGWGIKALSFSFTALKTTVQNVGVFIGAIIGDMSARFGGLGSILNSLVHGDFKGAKDDYLRMNKEILANAEATTELWEENNKKLAASYERVWAAKVKTNTPVGLPEGDLRADLKEPKDKNDDTTLRRLDAALKAKEAHLALELAAEGKFYEKSQGAEVAYWVHALATEDLNEKEKIAIRAKVATATMASTKEGLDATKAALEAEIAGERDNLRKKLELTMAEAQMYADGSKGRIEADRKVEAVEKEIENQGHALAVIDKEEKVALAQIESDEELKQIKFRESMGEITALKAIELERTVIAHKMDLDLAYSKFTLDNEAKTEEEKAKIRAKIEEMRASKEKQMADNSRQRMLQQRSEWQATTATIQTSMTDAFKGLANGTMTWGQAFKSVMNSVLQNFITMAATQLTKHLFLESAKTAASAAGTTARVGIEAAGAAESTAITVGTASKSILAKGWDAAAGAYSAIVGIPYVGPFLAPAAAAVALGAVLGMIGKISSAEGGWGQVPGDTMAQIHKDEMVLPARWAGPLRNMLEGGGGGEGGGHQHTHFHVHAIDGKDAARFIQQNGGRLASQVQRQARNFQGVGR